MPDSPLSDLRVIEVGHVVAAPYASLVLADLGADVVKIERPGEGDMMRSAGESGVGMFNALNRDKRSVALDLKADRDRVAFLDLVERADVLLENFGPGVMERLGLGYEALREVNPGLIYASIKGYADGPYADRPASDPIAEAMSGFMGMTGHEEAGPARAGSSVIDIVTANNAVISILLALRERDRTGEGTRITTPLFEAAVSVMGYWLAYRQLFDREPVRMGASHESQAPYNAYPTADGGHAFFGATSDHHWEAIQDVLDLPLEPETHEERLRHREEIDAAIREVTRERERDPLVAELVEAGVPAAPVNDLGDVVSDPHLREVGAYTTVEPEADVPVDSIDVPLFPVWSDGFDVEGGDDPPALGEHTDAVLEELGYDADG